MKNNKIVIDLSISSEKTLLAYAKMWSRHLVKVDWEAMENELKVAENKEQLAQLLTKYYGEVVEFTKSETGDLDS